MKQVAVLGTGLMGGPMARSLARAGFAVTAWNRDRAKAQALGNGIAVADTSIEAVEGADAVIVMLSSGPVCEKVLFGPSGAAHKMSPGALLIVMSSIGQHEAEAMARLAGQLGLRWIDAPVSGGTPAAEAGTLSIMAGGAASDVDAAWPIFDAMGRVTLVGPAGAGALTKLVNQVVVATTIVSISEAMLLAQAGGANPCRVREALLGGFAASRILDLHGARMIENDYTPGGPAKYQIKDTRAALAVADRLGLDLPALNLADQLFTDLVAHGGGDLDHSALFLELLRRNGLPVPGTLLHH